MPRDSEETQLLAAGAAEGGGGDGVVLLVQAGAARGGAEESADLVRVRGVGAIRVGGERGEIVGVGREEERFETGGRMGVRAAAVDGGEGMGRCGGHGFTLLKNVAAPA